MLATRGRENGQKHSRWKPLKRRPSAAPFLPSFWPLMKGVGWHLSASLLRSPWRMSLVICRNWRVEDQVPKQPTQGNWFSFWVTRVYILIINWHGPSIFGLLGHWGPFVRVTVRAFGLNLLSKRQGSYGELSHNLSYRKCQLGDIFKVCTI